MSKLPPEHTLEFLSEEFHRHMTIKQTTPGFSLPLALKTIVDEIIGLKKSCLEDLSKTS